MRNVSRAMLTRKQQATHHRLLAECERLSEDRKSELLAEARKGGALESTKSPVRDLIELLREVAFWRSVLLAAWAGPTPLTKRATGEQYFYLMLRLHFVAESARRRAFVAITWACRATDATRLYADIIAYLSIESTFDNLEAEFESDHRQFHDLTDRLAAVELIVDPAFAKANAKKEWILREADAGTLLRLDPKVFAKDYLSWLVARHDLQRQCDEAWKKAGIAPGESVPALKARSRPPLTLLEQAILSKLGSKPLLAKSFVLEPPFKTTSEDAIRHAIQKMRAKGYSIVNTRGAGYSLPHAPSAPA